MSTIHRRADLLRLPQQALVVSMEIAALRQKPDVSVRAEHIKAMEHHAIRIHACVIAFAKLIRERRYRVTLLAQLPLIAIVNRSAE